MTLGLSIEAFVSTASAEKKEKCFAVDSNRNFSRTSGKSELISSLDCTVCGLVIETQIAMLCGHGRKCNSAYIAFEFAHEG